MPKRLKTHRTRCYLNPGFSLSHCSCIYALGAYPGLMVAKDALALKSLFHSLGLRSTAARIAVYRTLTEAARPLTHAEVFAELRESGFDHATIFRNLNDLASVGVVARTDLGDHMWRFELRGEGVRSHREQHPHFLCTGCGSVTCLAEGAVSLRKVRGSPKALATNNVVVQVQGLCDDCRV